METVSLDSLNLLRPTGPSAGHLAASTSSDDQYPEHEIIKIQKFWRFYFPKLQATRAFSERPEAKAAAFFIAIGAQTSATVAMRAVLVSRGVHVYLALATVRNTWDDLRKRAIACFNNPRMPDTLFDSLDRAREQLDCIEGLLGDASEKLSKDHLIGQIERGSLPELRKALKDIGMVVREVGDEMMRIAGVVGKVEDEIGEDEIRGVVEKVEEGTSSP